ncbi:MAG: hypothetical protein ACUVRA_04565 [Candidatus Bathyarchaeaceae archaeon]
MSERKRRRRFFDLLGFDEEDLLFGREPAEGGSGYSISVTYDEKGKPVVQVKTYGDVDTEELRRDIEQRYPGARIEGLEKKPLIRIVDEEEGKEEGRSKKKSSTGS